MCWGTEHSISSLNCVTNRVEAWNWAKFSGVLNDGLEANAWILNQRMRVQQRRDLVRGDILRVMHLDHLESKRSGRRKRIAILSFEDLL